MNKREENQAQKMVKEHGKRKRWQRAVSALAAVAVFVTTYAMILPAITWERSLVCELPEHHHDESCYEMVIVPAEKQLVCTAEEHTHGEDCYEQVLLCTEEEREGHAHGEGCYERTLLCTEEEREGHTHGEDCFNEAGELTCGLEETEGHTHTDACWREDLVCELEEIEGHTHTEECYESRLTCTVEEHTHTDDCWEILSEEHEEQILVCELEEHEHTDACFDAPPAEDDGYYCGQIEHTHSEEQYCFFSDGSLRCTIPEHQHTLACKSNPKADVETAAEWEKTFANVELSGNWAEDVIAIAETQLGYFESSRNYEVGEDGVSKRGYTRYGDWYGISYGDWCAMFCSFCLNYAGVDRDVMPYAAGCGAWVRTLSEKGLYHGSDSGYVPKAGDLAFIDMDGNKAAEHVGFVSVGGSEKITTIEGNMENCVCTVERSLADGTIVGYGELPENPQNIKADESKTIESAAASDGMTVSVTGILPEGVWVEIKSVELTKDDITAAFGERAKIKSPTAYDIALYKDGALWQPEKTVSVSLHKTGIENKALAVLDAEGKAESVSARSGEDSLTFETVAIGRVIAYTQPPKMKLGAAPDKSGEPYSPGTIEMKPADTNPVSWPNGTGVWEYSLQYNTTGMFHVVYTPYDGGSGTKRTVLVVSWPEYGTMRAAAPIAGAEGVRSISFPDCHTAIIELEDNITEQATYGFQIAAANLTNAQAARWMDGGDMTTGYTATEYQLNEGYTAAQVLEEDAATAYATFTSTPMAPAAYTNERIAVTTASLSSGGYEYTFHAGISSIPDATNNHLSAVGDYQYGTWYECVNPWQNGMLRWEIPTVHYNSNALIEIKSIRIYVPDNKLKLSWLGKGNTVDLPGYYNDLINNKFDQKWNNWQIGERTLDPENGYYYYLVTPPAGTRWFNTGVGTSLTSRYYGMKLAFQLVSTDEEGALSPDTTYSAPDTVITYNIPGDAEGVTHSYTQAGPQVRTWKHQEDLKPSTAYNGNRYKNNATLSNNNVVIGSYQINEAFTYYNNHYYYNTSSTATTPRTEYVPEYTGPVTMHYEFPYSIQPDKMTLRPGYGWYNYSGGDYSHRNNEGEMTGITYTVREGETLTTYSIPSDQVAAFNSYFQTAAADSAYSFTFPGVSETARLETLDISWSKLCCTYQLYGVAGLVTNSLSGGNMSATSVSAALLRTSFDYHVAADWEDDAHTVPVTQYDMVQVKYDLQYDDVSHADSDYLWFRLKKELCPSLVGNVRLADAVRYANYLDGRKDNIGYVGLYVGHYGEYMDDIINPKIDLKMSASGDTTINMPNADMLAFFSGEFTAMPKLSGWVFEYTTLQHPEGLTWTVPQITEAAGQTVQIPLAEGDYFKTMSLRYEGTVSLPHSGPDDPSDLTYVLMDNIMLQRVDTDPFTDESIEPVSSIYSTFRVNLYGYLHIDNCTCDTQLHSVAPGQYINNPSGTTYKSGTALPYQTLFKYRQMELWSNSYWGSFSTPLNVAQGGSTSVSYYPKIGVTSQGKYAKQYITNFSYNYQLAPKPDYSYGTNPNGNNLFKVYIPFDIDYAAYIELVDDDFVIDLSNTMFMGVKADSGNVVVEELTRTDSSGSEHRFIKLSFAKGFVQPSAMSWDYDMHTGGYSSNLSGVPHSYYIMMYPGYAYQRHRYGFFISDKMQIGLTALPSASVGTHYPIGKVYYDYSELLEQYDAPNVTGPGLHDGDYSLHNDYNMTNYEFHNAVADTYHLSSSTTTETNKLFYTSLSGQKVIVSIAGVTGADTFPGKDGIYDVAERTTDFIEPDTENLNGLITITGSDENKINDMAVCVKLPRAGKSVEYTDADGNPASAESEITLELRGPITRTNKTGIKDSDFSILYTTAEDPTASSAYVNASSITDWGDVTGFKVIANEVAAKGKATLHLDLRTEKKETLDVLKAYMGGSYTYKLQGLDNGGKLGLSTWNYNNIPVTGTTGGILFWDTYNENGTKSTGTDNAGKCETGIKDIPVSLYDADNNLIMSTTTSTASATLGKFVLESWKADAGQYIVIGEPTVSGVTVKLTKNSTADFYKNQYDSDFDRNAEGTTHTLVLPELPDTGYNNIGAGFVKLPKLEADDITLMVGETKDLGAVLTYYLGMALPSTSYNISFEDAADETIADVTATTKIKTTTTNYNNSNARNVSDSTTVTGVASGVTTVRIYTVTAAGDTIEKIVNIRVTQPTLTVTKEVSGLTGCTAEFAFTAQLVGGSFGTPAAGADYTVDEDGVAHFSLTDSGSIELNVGDYDVILTEEGHDGFHVKFSEDSWVANGYSHTIEDAAGRTITVTNTANAALPVTGGIGAETIYALGVLLVLGSVTGLVIRPKRKKD